VPFLLDGMSVVPDRFLQLSIEQLAYPRSDLPDRIHYVGAPPAGSNAQQPCRTGGTGSSQPAESSW
jgi:hypothetical protein